MNMRLKRAYAALSEREGTLVTDTMLTLCLYGTRRRSMNRGGMNALALIVFRMRKCLKKGESVVRVRHLGYALMRSRGGR